jgi:hypothetical protein
VQLTGQVTGNLWLVARAMNSGPYLSADSLQLRVVAPPPPPPPVDTVKPPAPVDTIGICFIDPRIADSLGIKGDTTCDPAIIGPFCLRFDTTGIATSPSRIANDTIVFTREVRFVVRRVVRVRVLPRR